MKNTRELTNEDSNLWPLKEIAFCLFFSPGSKKPVRNVSHEVTFLPFLLALEIKDQLKPLNHTQEMTVVQEAYWWNCSLQKPHRGSRQWAEKVHSSRNKASLNLVACHFPQSLMRTRKWAEITCKVSQALVRSDSNLVRQVMLLAFSLLEEGDVDFQMRRYFYIRKDILYTWYGQRFVLRQPHKSHEAWVHMSCRSFLTLQLAHRVQSPGSPKFSLEIKKQPYLSAG